MADLVIRGGSVVDGTGALARRADVSIEGNLIAAIGPNLSGARTLDAAGCVVAPGFVDIHTHYDAQVFWDPALTPSCLHGVTTVVAGNCGFSIAPTRPGHREIIPRTLENVADMNPASLAAGIPWDFETHPDHGDLAARDLRPDVGARRRLLVVQLRAHSSQWSRRKPCARTPQRRNARSSCSAKRGGVVYARRRKRSGSASRPRRM